MITVPDMSRNLMKGDVVQLWNFPFDRGSVELHLNLRHYRNYQAWDTYLLSHGLTGASIGRDIFHQLSQGIAILCCCKEANPFEYSHVTCGAVTLKMEALRDGWQRSKKNHYWYCPVCKEIRLSSNSFVLFTRDRR